MIKAVTFFENIQDLLMLTGLNNVTDLLDAGFDLDDIDFGIAIGKELDEWDGAFYESWLLNKMENHCVGYDFVPFNGSCFYTVHHS